MQSNQAAPGFNPFAPPQAEVADVQLAGPALGGRVRRLLAVIADGLIQALAIFLLTLAWPGSVFNPAPGMAATLQTAGTGIALFLLIQGVPLVRSGQTLGKMLLGLRIVRSDGSRVGAARILGLRYLTGYALTLVPFFGPLWGLVDSLAIFRSSRKCLHDQIADTIVVNA